MLEKFTGKTIPFISWPLYAQDYRFCQTPNVMPQTISLTETPPPRDITADYFNPGLPCPDWNVKQEVMLASSLCTFQRHGRKNSESFAPRWRGRAL